MGFNTIIIIASVSLVLQVVLLFVIRNMKRKMKESFSHPILEKYKIRNTGDAWQCLNNSDISWEDKEVIQKYYQKWMGNSGS